MGTFDAASVDDLWATYDNVAKPTGSADLAFALGFASFSKTAKDWGSGLVGHPINILDLGHFKNGWTEAKALAARPPAAPPVDLDNWTAWRNAYIPGGE